MGTIITASSTAAVIGLTEVIVPKAINAIKGKIDTNTVSTISTDGYKEITSLRDLMTPGEVARYDEHWLNVAENISNEALDNQIAYIKDGGITKPGGAYKPAKISAAVDMNTIDNIFLNIKYFNNGAYAEQCANCKITFKDFSMLNK